MGSLLQVSVVAMVASGQSWHHQLEKRQVQERLIELENALHKALELWTGVPVEGGRVGRESQTVDDQVARKLATRWAFVVRLTLHDERGTRPEKIFILGDKPDLNHIIKNLVGYVQHLRRPPKE